MRNSVLKQYTLELQTAWIASVIELAANEDSEYARDRADAMETTCRHLATLCKLNIKDDDDER